VFTPPLSATFLILSGAVIGLVVGALTGFFGCLLLRLKIRFRDVVTDGILGAIAFPLVFAGISIVPWQNTITYHVGDTLVTSTMTSYQHPDLVAYTVAILLPLSREVHRFKNRLRSLG
jgi:hypothetical protein